MGGLNFIFFLNLISHVCVIFIALTVLGWMVIFPKEKSVLTREFTGNIGNNLTPALEEANRESTGELKKILTPTLSVFELMSKQYTEPDESITTYNNMLLAIASLVAGVFVTIVVTALVVGKTVANYPSLGQSYKWVVIEQIVLMSVVGVVEAVFFLKVASKYVPTKPSLIVTRVIEDLKLAFE